MHLARKRAPIDLAEMEFPHLHWRRVIIGGVLAELSVFAIVFPTLHFFGQQAFLVSILVASAGVLDVRSSPYMQLGDNVHDQDVNKTSQIDIGCKPRVTWIKVSEPDG
jgi:hypothetical protein